MRTREPRNLALWIRALAVLAVFARQPSAAQAPGAKLIHFTRDGNAASPLLLPGFEHDSVWSGIGAASDGNVYVAVSNHRQPGGNVALFRYDPARERMALLGDVKSVSSSAGNWMAAESQYKVHTFLAQHADGKLYLATMDHAPSPFLRGSHVYTIDPSTGTVTDFSKTQPFLMTSGLSVIPNTGQAAVRSGVFVETYGIKGLGLNPRVPNLLYAMTYPDGYLIKYELDSGAMEVVGQSTGVAYAFYVSNVGDVYYAVPLADGIRVLKYELATGATVIVEAALPGELFGAIAPTADGETVYALEAATKRIYRLDCTSDSLDFVTTACGTNWWKLFNLSLAPNGQALYFVSNNNSRSTLRRVDLTTGQCTEVLDIDAVLGTRDLCFGGVNVWDTRGNLYVPVWTFAATVDDLAILQVSIGDLALEASPSTLSTRSGGTQTLSLSAGPDQAGRPYLVVGSMSGTAPGTQLSVFELRLNMDRYLFRTLRGARPSPLPSPLIGASGSLGPSGRATAQFVLGPRPRLAIAGLEFHHAFLVFDAATGDVRFVSNSVPARLVR